MKSAMPFPIGNGAKNQLIDENPENKYYEDKYAVDLKNKNDSKSIIANHIEKNTTCLDVGCGVGYLGEALFKYKKNKVYGIELDKKAVEYARQGGSYVDVYNFSVTDRKGKEYEKFINTKLKFDYIVFADILEHVISPDDVILFFSKFLKPSGKILISLPNIAHFDIVRGLSNGKFNYGRSGLLDSTHLRFFTKKSFKQFIFQINDAFSQNFVVREIGKTLAVPDDLGNYASVYNILNRDNRACVLQYIYEISIDKKKSKDEKEDKEECLFEEIEKQLEEKKCLKERTVELEKRIVDLEKEVKDIYDSVSWKITKPLREGAAVLKKNKKK